MTNFKRAASAVALAAFVMSANISVLATSPFTDVSENASYKDVLTKLKAFGVVQGSNGKFYPDEFLKRSESIAMLERALGNEETIKNSVKLNSTGFYDVKNVKDWSFKYIAFAEKMGLAQGSVKNGKRYFEPDGKLTYPQFITMAIRALGYTDNDVAEYGKWPYNYIEKAKELNIITDSESFEVDTLAKRSDVAVIINNMLNSPIRGEEFKDADKQKKLLDNVVNNMGITKVEGTVTRVTYTEPTSKDIASIEITGKNYDLKDKGYIGGISVGKNIKAFADKNLSLIYIDSITNGNNDENFIGSLWGVQDLNLVLNSQTANKSKLQPICLSNTGKAINPTSVEYSSSDEKIVTVTADGLAVAVGEGNAIINVTVKGAYGEKVSKAINVNIAKDSKAPIITVSGIEEGKVYPVQVLPQILVDKSNSKITSTLNDQPYNIGTPINQDGQYKMVINAVDDSGNSAIKTVSFAVDTQAPKVTVANQVYMSSDNNKIDFSVDDLNFDKVLVSQNNIQLPVTQATTTGFSVIPNKFDDLSQPLLIESYDKAGNKSSVQVMLYNKLSVANVKSDNLKNIVVYFNKPVNVKTINTDNVKVTDSSTKEQVPVTFTLLQDNKTLIISNDDNKSTVKAFNQQGNYQVSINNIESKDNSSEKVLNYQKALQTFDGQVPVVTNIAFTSPKNLEVTFSEPIQIGNGIGQVLPITASSTQNAPVPVTYIQINGTSVYVSSVDTSRMNTEGKVVYTLGWPLNAGTQNNVTIKELKDYAGFKIQDTTVNAQVLNDTTAPKLIDVKVMSNKKVRVTFDEVVDENSVLRNLNNIKVDGNSVIAYTKVDDGKTYDLTLSVPLSSSSLISSSIIYNGLTDNYANTIANQPAFNFKADNDITAPVVTSATIDSSNNINVVFSEGVSGVIENNPFEIYDQYGNKLSNGITVSQTGTDNTTYTLVLQNASSLSGSYKLRVIGGKITDNSVNMNKLVEILVPINFTDKTLPKCSKIQVLNESALDPSNVGIAGQVNSDSDSFDSKIIIYFSKAMDLNTLSDKRNYIIDNIPIDDNDIVVPAVDGKSVTIIVNRESNNYLKLGNSLTLADPNGSSSIKLLYLKDTSGNNLDVSQFNTPLYGTKYNTSFTMDNLNVEAINKSSIRISTKDGSNIKSVDVSKIKFAHIVNASGQTNSAINPDILAIYPNIINNGNNIVLTISGILNADATFNFAGLNGILKMYTVASGAIVLSDDSQLSAVDYTNSSAVVADKIAPTLTGVYLDQTDASKIAIKFSENVNYIEGFKYDLSVFDMNTSQYLMPTDFDVSNNNGIITLQIKNTSVSGHRIQVSLRDGRFLVDAGGNHPQSFTAITVQNANGTDALITGRQ